MDMVDLVKGREGIFCLCSTFYTDVMATAAQCVLRGHKEVTAEVNIYNFKAQKCR